MDTPTEALLPEVTVIFGFNTNPCVVPLDDTLTPVYAIRVQSLTWRTGYTPPANTLWLECASVVTGRSQVNGQGAPIIAVFPINPNLTINEGHKTLPIWGSDIPRGTLKLYLKYLAVGDNTPQMVNVIPSDEWTCTLLINPAVSTVKLPDNWKNLDDGDRVLKRFRE